MTKKKSRKPRDRRERGEFARAFFEWATGLPRFSGHDVAAHFGLSQADACARLEVYRSVGKVGLVERGTPIQGERGLLQGRTRTYYGLTSKGMSYAQVLSIRP